MRPGTTWTVSDIGPRRSSVNPIFTCGSTGFHSPPIKEVWVAAHWIINMIEAATTLIWNE